MLIGLKLSPDEVEFATLATAWSAAGESEAFDSLWSFDHLYPRDGPGACLEGWTTVAALANRAPGKILGHLVLAAPYRLPSMLAKSATVMDLATDGRFVLGLGAGNRAHESVAYRLGMPARLGDRLALLESTLRWIRALWGRAEIAPSAPPVAWSPLPFDDLPEVQYAPANLTPGGPPIWLGTAGEQIGLRLVARYADGWVHGGGDVDAFLRRNDLLDGYLDDLGRAPSEITRLVQVPSADDINGRQAAVAKAKRFVAGGANHVVLQADPARGVDAIRAAEAVAADIRQALS